MAVSESGLEPDLGESTSVPTIRLLTQEIDKVVIWHTLGIHLDMTVDELTAIEREHPGDMARMMTAMLDKWLGKQTSPSWMSIIEALEKMSEIRLANKLRNKYMSPSQQPAAVPAADGYVCLAETQPTSSNVLLEMDSSDVFAQKIQELKDLYYKLVTETENEISSRDIKRFSQVHMTKEVTTVEELFDQLKPFFFLDYALLEKIIKVLLKQNQSAINEIDDYIQQLEQFKKSTTLQKFIEKIETAQNASPQTCTVTLQLSGSWLDRTISDLEKLLEELSHNKAAVPTRFNVVRKCVLVTYLVQHSKAISLIKAARPKISFMMKVGVCVLQVGDTVVTSTQSETSDFSFESSLIRSVKDNDIDVLSFLLDINTSPDATDNKGRTGLLWASYLGRTKAAKLLLKANANPNLHSIDGVTPLFMASQSGHSDIVSFLLNAKADSNLCKDNGVTPLFMASQNGYSDVIHLLLKANANPNLHRIDGVTPLVVASENGHSDIVRFLLNASADPNLCRNDGATPLFMASQNGHSDIVSFLLKANADANLCRDDRVTPLFMASWNGHSDIVNFLVKANADPNHCRGDSVTPLFMASQNGHSDIVSFLLKANADPNHCRDDGATPLFIASQSGNSDVVSILLKANANPNLCKDDGATPLMVASQYGHIAIVVSLLKANANPNHQTDKGVTPLMAACLNRHPKVVKLLLTNGADPDLRDSSNSTALGFALRSNSLESSKLLLAFGTNSSLQTPADLNMMVSDPDPLHVNSLLSQTPDFDMIDKGTSFNSSTHMHTDIHTRQSCMQLTPLIV